MPAASGELMAGEIPEARLHLSRRAGHYYSTDEANGDGVIADSFADCK